MIARPLFKAASLLALLLAASAIGVAPADIYAQDTHLLVVRGIAGDPEYRTTFHEWAQGLIDAASASGVPASQIHYLSERPDEVQGPTGEARREHVEAVFAQLAADASAEDRVFIVLIGHGTFRDDISRFNLPGPDLTAEEFGTLVDDIPAGQIAFVNTASASGAFVEALSAPGRVVVTATRSGGERNLTRFPEHFVAAYANEGADMDKNGRVSVLEAFEYARQEVDRAYQTANTIATEHPLLDDDGDGEGSETPQGEDSSDGRIAARLFLGEPTATSTALSEAAAADSVVARLVGERAQIEEQLATLRAAREGMDAEEYQAALEELLVELALKNREIRQRTGGA